MVVPRPTVLNESTVVAFQSNVLRLPIGKADALYLRLLCLICFMISYAVDDFQLTAKKACTSEIQGWETSARPRYAYTCENDERVFTEEVTVLLFLCALTYLILLNSAICLQMKAKKRILCSLFCICPRILRTSIFIPLNIEYYVACWTVATSSTLSDDYLRDPKQGHVEAQVAPYII